MTRGDCHTHKKEHKQLGGGECTCPNAVRTIAMCCLSIIFTKWLPDVSVKVAMHIHLCHDVCVDRETRRDPQMEYFLEQLFV
jgi:hypothetical protein